MANSINKTQPTASSPEEFITAVTDPQRREDGLILLKLFKRVTKMPARMWGPSIIGFGRYHYKYDSGREGDYLITGFSPRKGALSIYILPGYRDLSEKLGRLGKHKTGKSCIYINKLSDVDISVLEEIIQNGLAHMRANYQTWDT